MFVKADPAAWLRLLGGRFGDIVQQRGQLEQRRARVAADLFVKEQPQLFGIHAAVVQIGVKLYGDGEWRLGITDRGRSVFRLSVVSPKFTQQPPYSCHG